MENKIDPLRQKNITIATEGNIKDVCTFLSIEGLTLILDAQSYNVPFNIRLNDKPIETLLEAVKVTLGKQAQIIQREGYVYIGEPSDSDQSIDLFKLPGDAEPYVELFRESIANNTIPKVQGDRLIVRGSSDQLDRARQLYRQIIKRRRQYTIDVVFAELTRDQVKNAGIEITLAGSTQFSVTGAQSLLTGSYDLAGVLKGVFAANGQKTNQAQWQSNRLFCVEGEEASLQIGDEIAIRKRITTDTGFIQEADTQIFDAGTKLNATVYGVDNQLIRVDLKPEISFVRDYLDGVPTISTRRFTSSVYCAPDAIIVLGGQETHSQSVSGNTLPFTDVATNRNNKQADGRTFIFLQIKEVKGQNHGPRDQISVPQSGVKEPPQGGVQGGSETEESTGGSGDQSDVR